MTKQEIDTVCTALIKLAPEVRELLEIMDSLDETMEVMDPRLSSRADMAGTPRWRVWLPEEGTTSRRTLVEALKDFHRQSKRVERDKDLRKIPEHQATIQISGSVSYRWWREAEGGEKGSPPWQVEEQLHEAARERVEEFWHNGFTSGELFAQLEHEGEEHTYRGWWEIETDLETEEL